MGSFYNNNKVGKQAEKAVRVWLEGKGWKVIDASNHRFFQQSGVDFVAERKSTTYLLEVKSDPHPPKCVFLEYISNDEKGSPGWLETTSADRIFYYFRNYNRAVIFDPTNARDIITQWEYPAACAETTINGKVIYRSWGYIVPVDDLEILQELQLPIPKNCQKKSTLHKKGDLFETLFHSIK
ncbi:hypothetical protein M0534_00840 [Methylonatrum kenyense]|uniref:hypothetical protein n=1 Tax=Methylonatrum kenyense TaxID=455253 RepID=UPI0020BDE095|nr:hypothetical protein [Methylonatrum kenyense]MCK8514878.1 hypothetical protein [Methylonatrum kenyense]